MGRSFSEDDNDGLKSEFDDLEYEQTDKRRSQAKKRLDDYLEQKRLREYLGDDEFGDID